jgi:nitrogen fixation protein NifB
LRGECAARTLIERQLDAVRQLKAAGIIVKINTIVIPGINDEHAPEVAKTVAALGADIMNCMPLVPVAGSAFEDLCAPDGIMTARTRLTCGLHLPQMSHCARCRADAVGLVSETLGTEQINTLNYYAGLSPNGADIAARPYVAVASLEGALVNQHLGEAERVLIYAPRADQPGEFELKEIRPTPESGGGEARWEALADLLGDCRAFLVMAAGPTPTKILAENGVRVVEMEGVIEEGLQAVYANQPIPASLRRRFTGCGSGVSCKGAGTGCG